MKKIISIIALMIFLVMPFSGCKKIVKTIGKESGEVLAKDLSKNSVEKIAKKTAKESGSSFVGKSLGHQIIKKTAREKVEKIIEEEGLKSFLQYGNYKASKELVVIGTSKAKKELLSPIYYRKELAKLRTPKRNPQTTHSLTNSASYVSDRTLKEILEKGGSAPLRKIATKGDLQLLLKSLENEFNKEWIDNVIVKLSKEKGELVIIHNKFPETVMRMKGNKIFAEGGSLANAGPQNQFLNHILPNKEYILDGCNHYKTDNMGRVFECYSDRNELAKISRNTIRHKATQKKIVNKLDGKVGQDDGGHLFSNNSGGQNEMINQVPMNSKLNRNGAWRKMEEFEERELHSGKRVISERKLLYEGISKRPYAIKVTIKVDGKIAWRETISNPSN